MRNTSKLLALVGVAVLVPLASCNDPLRVSIPDIVQPGQLSDSAALGTVRAGVLGDLLTRLLIQVCNALPRGGRLTLETANATLTDTDAAETPGRRAGAFVRLRLGIPAERIVTTWPLERVLEWAGGES